MNTHKVTCIMPAYNEGPRVGRTLEELLAIDLIDELIAINDGSEDDTLAEMQKFQNDPRLKIINHVKNLGKGAAIAAGIEAASCDIIVLVDSDMCGIRTDHIAAMIDPLAADEADLVLALPQKNSSWFTVFKSYVGIVTFMLTGLRSFKRQSILPLVEEIKTSRYGVEILTFNYFLKKGKRIKAARLQGISFVCKIEKIKELDAGQLQKVSETVTQYLTMLGNVAKSGVEYPPVPSTGEIVEKLRAMIKQQSIDEEVFQLIAQEEKRQVEGLELIASENYVSTQVLRALGSPLTNKYSEGYPRKRYYEGNKYIDEIELLAQKRALQLFNLDDNDWGVNVQPYSGSPANQAVYMALLNPGDTVMGLALPSGGHLTHGWKVNFSAKFFNSIQYNVNPNGEIDFEELESLALEHKPKLIWAGATAYSRNYDYAKFAEIAKKVGAYLAADIAHVAGLIAAGVHNSPFEYADVVTTTTHKTLRGPRGAMIFARSELADKINSAVFPGLQGGPHNHQTAAIAVALGEALSPEFKEYGTQVVKNAQALAKALINHGVKVVGGGTENHLMLLDFSGFSGGRQVELALEAVRITTNKNTIPGDKNPPYYPSGIRIGTPALTSRGMVESDMKQVAEFIAKVVNLVKNYKLPEEKEERRSLIQMLKADLAASEEIKSLRNEVRTFAMQFPVRGITE